MYSQRETVWAQTLHFSFVFTLHVIWSYCVFYNLSLSVMPWCSEPDLPPNLLNSDEEFHQEPAIPLCTPRSRDHTDLSLWDKELSGWCIEKQGRDSQCGVITGKRGLIHMESTWKSHIGHESGRGQVCSTACGCKRDHVILVSLWGGKAWLFTKPH